MSSAWHTMSKKFGESVLKIQLVGTIGKCLNTFNIVSLRVMFLGRPAATDMVIALSTQART